MNKRIYASDEGAGLLRSQPSGRIATAGLGHIGRVTGKSIEIKSVTYGSTSIYSLQGHAVLGPAPSDDETTKDEPPVNP